MSSYCEIQLNLEKLLWLLIDWKDDKLIKFILINKILIKNHINFIKINKIQLFILFNFNLLENIVYKILYYHGLFFF